MLDTFWSRLHRRRSILPARDLFDAELDLARRAPGCALCRLVSDNDRHGMHSLLWEYCTDPYVGAQISNSWGYCPFHIWSLATIERERMGDEMGVSILYQPLLKQLLRSLPPDLSSARKSRSLVLPVGPPTGSAQCRFCLLAQREEANFLVRLAHRYRVLLDVGEERPWNALDTVLCLPHIGRLMHACTLPGPSRRTRRAKQPRRVTHDLARLLASHSLRHVAQADEHRVEQQAVSQNEWRTVAQRVALFTGDAGALPLHIHSHEQAARPIPIFCPANTRDQCRAERACPVCAAVISSTRALCLQIFDEQDALPEGSDFCAAHSWLLAGTLASAGTPQRIARYRSWLQWQLEHRRDARAEGDPGQPCLVCAWAAGTGERTMDDLLAAKRWLSEHEPSKRIGDVLLCLPHWKAMHERCARTPGGLLVQTQLWQHQQVRLAWLDEAVEAYIASFNAGRRERGDIPDVPGAAWAWERLLAFFAGEADSLPQD